MPSRIACLIVLMPFAVAAGSRGEKSPKDDLEGAWKLVEFEVEGKTQEFPPLARWMIKHNKVLYGGEELAVLTIDSTTTPRSIDLNFTKAKRVQEGIYALDGDNLKICASRVADGVKERPDKFTTEGKPDWRLLVFKRNKVTGDGTEGASGFVGITIRNDKENNRLLIGTVIADGPAKKAGLMKDDVLLKIGATEPAALRQAVDLMRRARPGSELVVRIKRGDKEHDIPVKIGLMPFFLLDP